MNLFQDTYIKALIDNRKNVFRWTKYKEDNETLKESLSYFSKRYKPKIMIPIGKKAFMKGHLVHTDEILVALGDSYFLKSNSAKAIDICQRRIQDATEHLDKLEKESKLFEERINMPQNIFENIDTKEVIEPFNEEEDDDWRIKHREKERKYKQKLKELKESEKSKTIQNEKDIWDRLDALQLQEELEDELDRLGLSDEDDEEEGNSFENTRHQEDRDSDDFSTEEEETKVENNNKKCVRFKDETENSLNKQEASSNKTHANIISKITDAISENVVERKPDTTLTIKPSFDRPISRFKSSKS